MAARLTAPPPEPVKSHHNHVTQLASPPPSHHHVQQTNSPGSDTHDLKRRLGAGTREVHNKLEKNRRAHLKECFELLRRQLPTSHDDKKPSNLSVLHSALRYIQSLKRKERDYEHEMERLAREKIACQQRLAALKKELSAQWDHIDFATLLPEAPLAPATQATPVCAAVSVASTAPASSRGTGRSFDSDEDFEFEEMDDELEMQRGAGGQRSDVSPQHSASTSTASERGHPSDVEDLTMSSRPGSSRDQYSSPPPPAPSLAARPPEHPHRGPPTLSLAAELARNNAVIKGEPVSVVKTEGKVELLQSNKLQVAPPQIHLSPQLVSAPGIMSSTGTTIMGPAIQLLATQPLRMITPDHRQQTGKTFI
ncbi:hypothetical protein B566_EDAN005567 [Ephemera danica]|nr:hypothetical protein B566_EDAN005567 [Ephemera danica]